MDPTVSSPIGQLNAFNNPNSSGEDQSYQPNVPSTPPSTRRSQRSTPPRNILAQSRLSEDAKMRLSNVAPDQKRCLITLVDRPLQCSHILPRATSPDIVSALNLYCVSRSVDWYFIAQNVGVRLGYEATFPKHRHEQKLNLV